MMSSSNPSSSTAPDRGEAEGLDVRSTAVAFAMLVALAAALAVIGFRTRTFPLLFAGLPVSAIFTAVGGEFVVAWPVDAAVWVAAASWPGRAADLFDRQWRRRMGSIVLIGLVYGAALSLLVEPAV